MFVHEIAATECFNCPAGKYQTGIGIISDNECNLCPAGKYSSTVGSSSGELCAGCQNNSWSTSGSIGPCTCNAGFYKPESDSGCMDIDECISEPLLCNGNTCVNTIGSYHCLPLTSNSSKYPVCGKISPNSCNSLGGSIISIQIVNVSFLGQNESVKVVRIAGTDSPVQGNPPLIQFTCPPSKKVGTTVAQFMSQNKRTLCVFAFLYTPGPAIISPQALRLDGGSALLDLSEYLAFFGQRICFIVGGVINIQIFLNSSQFEILAPTSAGAARIPLFLDCEGAPASTDLGVYLQYVAPSEVSFVGVNNCIRFNGCKLNMKVTSPPPVLPLQSLTFQISGAIFLAVSPSTTVVPSLQVFSFYLRAPFFCYVSLTVFDLWVCSGVFCFLLSCFGDSTHVLHYA